VRTGGYGGYLADGEVFDDGEGINVLPMTTRNYLGYRLNELGFHVSSTPVMAVTMAQSVATW
jgi:hypothetical protein